MCYTESMGYWGVCNCENECVCDARLREREERCRRKEPRCDVLQLGRLQEKLAERDQLIKRLMVRPHTLSHTHTLQALLYAFTPLPPLPRHTNILGGTTSTATPPSRHRGQQLPQTP